jgi:hypothetical protein
MQILRPADKKIPTDKKFIVIPVKSGIHAHDTSGVSKDPLRARPSIRVFDRLSPYSG